jgi:hypothetical protein
MGDARQLVSCIYGVAEIAGVRTDIGWFLAEDTALCKSKACEEAQKFGVKIVSVTDFFQQNH